MQPDRRLAALSYAAACAAAVLVAPSSAHAADYSWATSASGTWTDAVNWSPNSGTPGAADTATFNAAGVNGTVAVALNGNKTVTSLTFANTGTTAINASAANQTLTLTSGLTINSGAGAVTLGTSAANLITQASGNVTITNNSASLLTFDAGATAGSTSFQGVAGTNTLNLAGSGNILFAGSIKDLAGSTTTINVNNTGTGTVEFVGNATKVAAVTVNSGRLALRSVNALGSTATTLTLNGGTLTAVGDRVIPAAVSIVLGGNPSVGFSSSGTISPSGAAYGVLTLAGSVDLGGQTRTINAFSSTTLTGAISNGGIIKTGNGGLQLANNSTTTPSTYAGPTIVLDGTLYVGTDSIGNAALPVTTPVSVASGATFGAHLTGSLTIGSLSSYQGTGGSIRMGDVGACSLSIGADNTDTTFTGKFIGTNPNAGGGMIKIGTGTLTLTGASTFNGSVAVRDGTLAFTTIGNVGSSSPSSLFSPIGGVNATAIAQATIPLGNITTTGTLKYIGTGAASSDRVINLAGTTGGGALDASGTGPITFTSNLTATGTGAKALTLTGSNAGANTLQGAIPDSSGGATSVAKSGAGQWVLTGANTYTGLTTVGAGTLVLGPSAWAPVLSPAGADVKGGTLFFDYTSTSSPAGSVFSQIAAGAIKTSNASATVTVGMLDDGASKVKVLATWYGDANLDGRLNADDYALIDRGVAKGLTGWVNGDFNYSGAVDSADYLLIDATYGASGVSHDAWAALLAERQSQFGDAYVQSLVAAVPEPATVSLLGVGVLPFLGRRRRLAAR